MGIEHANRVFEEAVINGYAEFMAEFIVDSIIAILVVALIGTVAYAFLKRR